MSSIELQSGINKLEACGGCREHGTSVDDLIFLQLPCWFGSEGLTGLGINKQDLSCMILFPLYSQLKIRINSEMRITLHITSLHADLPLLFTLRGFYLSSPLTFPKLDSQIELPIIEREALKGWKSEF